MKISTDIKILAGAAVALVLGAYFLQSRLSNVAAGAVGVVADVGAGAVVGVGDILGVPRTNETECEKAMREGRTWDASFACDAGTFLGHVFN
jgi:hypothetical protein